MDPDSGPNHDWRTTRWSVVLHARAAQPQPGDPANQLRSDDVTDHSPQKESLQVLCQSYWFPLYAYLRRKGYGAEDAQDLTQDFLFSLIEKDFLKVVDPKKGRFRWFMMHAIGKFAASWTAAQSAQKRGGGRQFFSLEFESGEKKYQNEPLEQATPETLFDRQWALAILHQALENLESGYTEDGKTRFFETLKVFILPGTQVQSYADAAEELGLSDTAVKVAIHRLRQKYQQAVRDIVMETIEDPNEIDAEIDQLLTALG